MSDKSRSRLLKILNSLYFETVTFVTLTYRYNQTDPRRAYSDLRAWHQWLVRKVAEVGLVWRAERQERGAIHYHIFAVDAVGKWKLADMKDAWLYVTHQEGDTAAHLYGVDAVEIVDLQRKDAGVMLAYMSKYTAKGKGDGVGRNWGVLGRGYLKLASTSADVIPGFNSTLAGWLLRAGARAFQIDGGGVVYHLYLGSIGGGNCVGNAADFMGRFEEDVIDLL